MMDRSSGRSWARMKYSPHFWFGSFGCCLTRALGQYQASLGFRDQDWKLNVLANDMRKGFWNSGTSRHRPLHDQRRPLNLCRSLQSFPCIGFLINRTQKKLYTQAFNLCTKAIFLQLLYTQTHQIPSRQQFIVGKSMIKIAALQTEVRRFPDMGP